VPLSCKQHARLSRQERGGLGGGSAGLRPAERGLGEVDTAASAPHSELRSNLCETTASIKE